MSDQPRPSAAPVKAYFDRTPQPFGDGPPDPLVYDALQQALRQRTVIIAAKRPVDVCYISGLDRATAERHLRWRPGAAPSGLGFRPAPDVQEELAAAQRLGDIVIEMDDAAPRYRLLERIGRVYCAAGWNLGDGAGRQVYRRRQMARASCYFAFGGPNLRTLFCCAHTSVHTLRVKMPGNPHPRCNLRRQ